MNSVTTSARFLGRWSKRSVLTLLVCTALLLLLLRALLPVLAEGYRQEIEQTLSRKLNASVSIDSLEIRWWGWGPVLEVQGFGLHDTETDARLINFHHARAKLDVSQSLAKNHLVVRDIHLRGEHLLLQYAEETGLKLIPSSPLNADPDLADRLLDWLATFDDLRITFDRSEIRHAQNNQPIAIGEQLKLHLHSVHSGVIKRRLDAMLIPIHPAAQQLQMRFDLTRFDHDWQVEFYLNGNNLDLQSWPLIKASDPDLPTIAGRADVQIWGLWREQSVREITGQASLRDGRVKALALPQLITRFDWRSTDQGWQWRSNWRHQKSPALLNSRIDATMTNHRLRGEARHLPVKLLTDIALPWLQPAQAAMVQQLNPHGELTELVWAYSPQDKHYELAARFQDLSTQAWQRIPGITSLNGQLALNRAGGSIVVDSRAMILDSQLLRTPIFLNTLKGALSWRLANGVFSSQNTENGVFSSQNTENGVFSSQNTYTLSPSLSVTNDDFKARLSGNIRLRPGQSPRLDLQVDYQDIDIAQIYRYLPVAVIKPKLLSWLDNALVSGEVTRGDMVFHGSIHDFPFDNQQGIFEAGFQVRNMVLDYRDEWPLIEKLNAKVEFHNRQFSAYSNSGQLLQGNLDEVHADIPDLKNAILAVKGKVYGPGASMLRFLSESPLQKKLGKYIANMSVTGANTLDLELHIPLKRDKKTRQLAPVEVSGRIGFAGGSIDIARQNIDLANIHGTMNFTEKTLQADDLKVVFRGDPALLSIDTKIRKNRKEMQFRLRGKLGLRALFDNVEPLFSPYITGKSHWDILVKVPESRRGVETNYKVDLQSSLQGTSISLPAPLTKGKASKRPIRIHADINEPRGMQLDIVLDDRHHALLAFEKSRKKSRYEMNFERGELRLGSGRATLPEAPGLTITGRLKHYSALGIGVEEQSLPGWFNRLDARIDQLTLGNYVLYDTDVQISRDNDSIRTTLNGDDIIGSIIIPAAPTLKTPLTLRLQQLALHSPQRASIQQTALLQQTENTGPKPDPRNIPPLHAVIDKLYLDDGFLGRAEFRLTPDRTGIKLQQLTLQSDQQQITANGAWHVVGNQQRSRLEAALHSPQLGKTLSALGYELGLQDAETSADVALNWQGGFADIDLPSLQGTSNFNIGKGQLSDIDPGLGRMVGLFSLYSLTRRLQLDFSDLFEAGLAFDRIDGQISFNQGIAHTEAITLQGPSAHIIITGTADLQQETYDQIITVMPRLGTPLAIAGTLAGGPVVGAAVFFADQLGLSKAVRYRYAVTGAWAEPSIEPMRSQSNSNDNGWAGNR